MKKPEFNDEFAKTKLREHKTFGGKTVEIMYGAKDENGNPVSPRDGVEDGHGTWSGIVVNGDDYRMFVWKHSAAEDGNVEYGTDFKEDALGQMESDVLKKWDLAKKAEKLAREGAGTEEDMKALQDEFAKLTVWDVPTEKTYTKRFEAAVAEFGPKMEAYKKNAEEKKNIVDQAKELLNSENFKNARASLNELKNKLYEVGSAGSDKDDEFRAAIREVENTLRDKQRDFYANLDANRQKAAAKKEEIIADTTKRLADVSNYKDTNVKLNALFDAWKEAGSAGHETDEKLWSDFNTLRQEFFDARSKFYEDRRAQWKQSIDAKEKLIAEAKEIGASNDYSKANTERMKELDKQWKQAGYSGKDRNDALWDEFTSAKEVFWSGKKAQFTKAVEEDVKKAEAAVEKMKKEIEDLEYKKEVAANPAMEKDAENEIYIKKSQLLDKEKTVEDLKKKIAE